MNINECCCRPYGWLGLDGNRCIRVIPRQICRAKPVASLVGDSREWVSVIACRCNHLVNLTLRFVNIMQRNSFKRDKVE